MKLCMNYRATPEYESKRAGQGGYVLSAKRGGTKGDARDFEACDESKKPRKISLHIYSVSSTNESANDSYKNQIKATALIVFLLDDFTSQNKSALRTVYFSRTRARRHSGSLSL